MKWNNYIYIGLLLQLVFAASCYDEKDLVPSEVVSSYSVPQGTHDYDDVIVDIYNQYGSCLLYKYTDKDTYWTPSGWMDGVLGEGGKSGYIVTPADETYVGEQVGLIRDAWFSLYSDEFLKECLPIKIMLCADIDSVYMVWDFSSYPFKQIYQGKEVKAWYNYDNICVSYGSEAVTRMTKADSLAFQNKMNQIFIASMIGRKKSVPSKEFEEITNYSTNNINYLSAVELWKLGVPRSVSYNVSVDIDWQSFLLMMVCCSEEFLTRTPEYSSDWDYTMANWDGLLNPVKDVNGLLKKRYDLVRNYFIENYNMDLQKVGNALNR